MSLWSRLFGGKTDEDSAGGAAAEDYKDFRIFPEPIREGQVYRVAARIEKTIDGVEKVHQLIRADTMASLDEAVAASVNKARQMIDEQGDRLFGE